MTYKDGRGSKSYDYCHVDMTRCRIAAHALMKKTGGDEDLVTSFDASTEEVMKAIAGMKNARGGLQNSPTWKCGKCLAYCPTGHWQEKFKDTRLSDHLPL